MLQAQSAGWAIVFASLLSRYLPESAYIRSLTNSVSWGFHFFARVLPRRRTWRWGSTLLVPGEPAIDRIFEFIVSCRFMVFLRLHCPSTLPFSSSARCSTSFRYFTYIFARECSLVPSRISLEDDLFLVSWNSRFDAAKKLCDFRFYTKFTKRIITRFTSF